jgi:hypothetical protein
MVSAYFGDISAIENARSQASHLAPTMSVRAIGDIDGLISPLRVETKNV